MAITFKGSFDYCSLLSKYVLEYFLNMETNCCLTWRPVYLILLSCPSLFTNNEQLSGKTMDTTRIVYVWPVLFHFISFSPNNFIFTTSRYRCHICYSRIMKHHHADQNVVCFSSIYEVQDPSFFHQFGNLRFHAYYTKTRVLLTHVSLFCYSVDVSHVVCVSFNVSG